MNLKFEINKPIHIVFEYLTDMRKFVSVHPVISKIDNISGNNFLVHETLTLVVIPISFTYPVTIDQNFNEKKVVIRAKIMKIIGIEMSYSLTSENNSTIVNETISFKSPFPIKSLMQKTFKKQHTVLFKNIETSK